MYWNTRYTRISRSCTLGADPIKQYRFVLYGPIPTRGRFPLNYIWRKSSQSMSPPHVPYILLNHVLFFYHFLYFKIIFSLSEIGAPLAWSCQHLRFQPIYFGLIQIYRLDHYFMVNRGIKECLCENHRCPQRRWSSQHVIFTVSVTRLRYLVFGDYLTGHKFV